MFYLDRFRSEIVAFGLGIEIGRWYLELTLRAGYSLWRLFIGKVV